MFLGLLPMALQVECNQKVRGGWRWLEVSVIIEKAQSTSPEVFVVSK